MSVWLSTAGYALGDIGPAGGYIFYENPNYAADGWRYLEAAPSIRARAPSGDVSGGRSRALPARQWGRESRTRATCWRALSPAWPRICAPTSASTAFAAGSCRREMNWL